MNKLELAFQDDKNKQGALVINGQRVQLYYINKLARNGFDTNQWFMVRVANIHNQSNPLNFEAASIKTLIKKLVNHPYQLVRF